MGAWRAIFASIAIIILTGCTASPTYQAPRAYQPPPSAIHQPSPPYAAVQPREPDPSLAIMRDDHLTTYPPTVRVAAADEPGPIRDPYVGTCDCPYDLKRNGHRCGATSAYSRPGGRTPFCYQ